MSGNTVTALVSYHLYEIGSGSDRPSVSVQPRQTGLKVVHYHRSQLGHHGAVLPETHFYIYAIFRKMSSKRLKMAILNFQMAQFVEQLLTIIAFGITKIINMNSKDFKVSIRFGIFHFVT